MSDVMFKPYLVDSGWGVSEISFVVSVVGMGFSIAGSLVGGVVCRHGPLGVWVERVCVWRILPHFIRLLLSAGVLDASAMCVGFVVCSEALLSGALTTLVFSMMMLKVCVRM